ncbi:MAG: DUF4286 family protein [Ignavibacteriae bacterium]|nr:DUF4286 family protein [Ignavibacteriota bacterium]
MIQYTVTVSVPNELAREWETWMTEKHIDDVMATGKFISAHLWRLQSPEGSTYTRFQTQYAAESMEDYDDYRMNFAPSLQADHSAVFSSKVTASREILESIKKW